MTASTTDGRRDDLAAGLAAVEARLDAMDDKLEEGFSNIEKLIGAKLDPVVQATAEQRRIVNDHEKRLTILDTAMEKEVVPAVKEVWATKKAVAALEDHAKRCDERSKTSGDRWWGIAQGIIIAVAGIIIGWLGSLIWAGMGR